MNKITYYFILFIIGYLVWKAIVTTARLANHWLSKVLHSTFLIGGQEFREFVLVIRMPPAQGWPVFGNVLHGPSHAEVVGFAVHIIVGTHHVKASRIQFANHEFNDLSRHPGTTGGFVLVEEDLIDVEGLSRGFRLASLRFEHDGTVHPTGNQQGGVQLATVGSFLHQVVFQSFRVRLEGRLGHIVREIARWHGDALFRPGVDDEARLLTGLHSGHKGQTTVDGTVRVDSDHPVHSGHIRHAVSTQPDAGIVHQDVTALLVLFENLPGEVFDGRLIRDVHHSGFDPPAGRSRRGLDQL